MATQTSWQTITYGYNPVYWITIAGLPGVWTERALGKSLPSGFADFESPTLVIDDSAQVGTDQVDRDRGIGVGLPLSFKLLDSATLRAWMRRWSLATALTSDLAHGATTANVADATAWPSSGHLYIGGERVYYGSKTTSTFTGLTRARSGTLAQTHRVGTTAQVITDLPRFWSGRDVTLYAAFADPTGHVCGTTLAAQSIMIWRGRLDGRPSRESDGFTFEALSLGRLIDVALPAAASGKVVSTAGMTLVDPNWRLFVAIGATDAAGAAIYDYQIEVYPFAAYSPGDTASGDQMRADIAVAWAAGVTAASATADLGPWYWFKNQKGWFIAIGIDDNPLITKVDVSGSWGPGGNFGQSYQVPGALDLKAPVPIRTGHYPTEWGNVGSVWVTHPPSIAVKIDDGDPVMVPDYGKLKITQGDLKAKYSYTFKGNAGDNLFFGGLTPVAGQAPLSGEDLDGATVELLTEIIDDFATVALTVLESSGTGTRGPYDTATTIMGYGLPDDVIDETSFADALAGTAFGAAVTTSEASFVDLLGGLLALSRLAVVALPSSESGTAVKLTVVQTGPGSDGGVTIRDSDLLAHAGEPVISVGRAENPNCIKVERATPGQDDPDVLTYNNRPLQEAFGLVEATYAIGADDIAALAEVAFNATAAAFQDDQTGQAIELLVHPAIQADVGSACWLELTHPSLWSYRDGEPGYTGPGRVVGRVLDLAKCAVTLRILIDGGTKVLALSPSAPVQAASGSTSPSWIDVEGKYFDHFRDTLDASGTGDFRVYHYHQGQAEGVAEFHTVTDVTLSGANCRLAVSASTGHSLTLYESHLTLPPSGTTTDFQDRFAHVLDGSSWG